MKDIIVIGKHGQLSRALASRAQAYGLNIVAAFDVEDQDLTAPENEVRSFAQSLPQADGLIIAAAYTAVDNAEKEPKKAQAINETAPKIIAQECARRNIPLVHVSTDYVFNGESKTPWQPDDKTDPISVYGQTKLDGEIAVMASQARAVIHRTSWVYDGTGKNFLQTMLRLAKERDQLSIVHDQVGRPTYAGHLADACLVALEKLIQEPNFQGGIFHVSNTGTNISWAEFAEAIFEAGSDYIPHSVNVKKIPSSEYPTPAKRPANSVMDTTLFESTFNYNIPSWEDGLKAAFTEWEDQQNSGKNNV